jgi:hypothetical protein
MNQNLIRACLGRLQGRTQVLGTLWTGTASRSGWTRTAQHGATSTLAETYWSLTSAGIQGALGAARKTRGWGASEAVGAHATEPGRDAERARVRHTRQTEARCDRRHMKGTQGWYSAEGPAQGQRRGHTRTQQRLERRARCDVHDIWRSYDHTFNKNTHVCERLSKNGDDLRRQTRRKRLGAAVTGWISHAAAARIEHLIAIPSKHKVATQ